MQDNTYNNYERLALVERTQTGNNEIYAPATSIPAGGAMPAYTSTHTSDNAPRYRRMQDMARRRLFAPTIENLCNYYDEIKRRYEPYVEEQITKLYQWRIDVYARFLRFPNREDYNRKLAELYCELAQLDPRYSVEKYFAGGADDTAGAGAYLLSLLDKKKDIFESYAMELLAAIQWLIGERDELPGEEGLHGGEEHAAEALAPMPEAEPEKVSEKELSPEDAALKNTVLNLSELKTENGKKQYNLGEIYTVLIFLCKDKPWAKNNRQFAAYIAEIVDKTPKSIEMAFHRYNEKYEDLSLDDIETYIATPNKKNNKQYEKMRLLYSTMKERLVNAGVI